jgi:hypothetical protein
MARVDGMPHLELISLHSESADGCNARIVRHVASRMQVNTLQTLQRPYCVVAGVDKVKDQLK